MSIRPLNSIGGFSVGQSPVTIIYGNGDITTLNLSANGNVAFTGSNISLGQVANVRILGGTSNQFLSTDGTGNLSFQSLNTIGSGTSNITVLPSGNILFSIAGNSNVGIFTGTGLNVNGYLTTSGNITSINANLGNLATANFINVSNNITVTGNVIANNFIGNIGLTGNNTEVLFNDGNVVSGNTNFTYNKISSQLSVNGNISINSYALTNNIQSITGNLNLYSNGANSSINLIPNGNGTINASGFEISNVGSPTHAQDAATKEYVDNATSAGLTIHTAVRVETPSPLTATYAQGGTVLTITSITSQSILTTSTNHALAVDDMIVFDSSFNGIIAGNPYFVYAVPASNQITISSSFNGPEIITLTNGSGLSQTSRANSGIGATLTNSGTQQALVIDNVALNVFDRVLVYRQVNASHNGIYTVTNIGSGSTNWVLTRSTDSNKYQPNSTTGMSYGDYFFVRQGDAGAGESYVNNTQGVIIIGTTPITFVQFSDTQVYTAGTGLLLNGTQFVIANTSVTIGTYGNGDRVPQYTVNQQGQLTYAANVPITSNAANLSGDTLNSNILYSNLNTVGNLISLTVIGNLSSGNANLGNLATANFVNVASNTVTGNLTVNNNISGNTANLTGNLTSLNANLGNLVIANFVNVASNIVTSNLTVNLEVTGNTANFTGNIKSLNANLGNLVTANFANFASNTITNNLTVNNNIAGNTANFSGNITSANANLGNLITANFANIASNTITNNLTVNNNISGNTANFTGNITSANANLGNLITANFVNVASNTITNNLTVNLELSGNTANFSGNIKSLNANLGNLVTANFANIASNTITNNLTVNNNISGNTANFSGNITSANANLGNLITANFVNVASNIVTSNLTVNLALTGNTANFSGNITSANANLGNLVVANYFTGTLTTNAQPNVTSLGNLTSLIVIGNLSSGNANLGNLLTANFANIASNIVTSNLTVNLELAGNTANFTGNITSANANLGNLVTANFATISSNITSGNANLGNLVTANFVNVASNVITNNLAVNLELAGNTANFTGNITSANANLGNLVTANFANIASNIVTSNLTVNLELAGNTANFIGNIKSLNANLGNLITANFANIASNTITNNLTVNNNISGNTANFVGNILSLNANLGNLVTANFANIASNLITNNLTVNADFISNNGVFTGNLTSGNANLGNLVTANFANIASNIVTSNLTINLELVGNTANFSSNIVSNNLTVNNHINANTANITGNLVASNLIGSLANGSSSVKVYNNANIEITVNGVSNVASFTSTGLYVVGEMNTTAGNVLSNGNVIANSFVKAANANITGEGLFGSVKTANIIAPVGNITISAAGVDQNIILAPSGNGVIDVGLHRITDLADPINPHDATTKEYVDNVAQGVFVHAPVVATSTTNLNATYANGGSVLTTIAITNNKTIQFSTAHGLNIGDEIYWLSAFNGILAFNAYFVYSTPASDSITVKNGFNGAEVLTLTNGSGLSQTAQANSGVGATLTNAGANAALVMDSVALTSSARVLVQGQTNQIENGIYTVTNVGAPDSPGPGSRWVLTRSTTEDVYDPKSVTGLALGDYFFVSQGTFNAGASYMLNSPAGEILFGYSNINFVQFSSADAYTGVNGINITGTIISANTDNVTTSIVSGNIVVKASANLTTPNLGDATFSSLSWNTLSNGNVTANNLSIGNIANITANLTVGGNIQANGTISSNSNISGLNFTTTGNVEVSGNILTNNLTVNNNISGNTANLSGNLTALNANLGNLVTANFANIASNIVTSNLTVNLELTGNTANFTGNITSANANLGNLVIANFANIASNIVTSNLSVNLELIGNTANFSGNIISANANLGNLITANFIDIASNTVTSNLTVNNHITGNTANFSGNIISLNADLGNLVTANFFTGTLTTNAQPNITSVGNLTSLVVIGNIDAGNVNSLSGTIAGLYLAGTLTTANQPNITSVGSLSNLTVLGNIDANTINGNLYGNVFGNFSGNITAPGLNTEIMFNDANLINASSNFTFNKTTNVLTLVGNANVSGILTDNYYYSNGSPVDFQQPAGSNNQIQFNNNNDFGASANLTFDSANNILTVIGTANSSVVDTPLIELGNTISTWATVTTTSTAANQTIASYLITSTDITGFEFFVKGVDSMGAKYSVAKLIAVSDGSNVDYTNYATVNMNGSAGTVSVNVVTAGASSNIELQVTPSSSNSTVWVSQYKLI